MKFSLLLDRRPRLKLHEIRYHNNVTTKIQCTINRKKQTDKLGKNLNFYHW